ncbi:MAG TPA: 4Fe-4S binding protein [Anaeromyxobacteraceae bacterium]
MRRLLTGAEAIARGASECGVALVTGRAASPPLGALLDAAACEGIHTERTPSERLALQLAAGASLAGGRAVAVLGSLEGAADVLHALATSGATGGLVALAVDDPALAFTAVKGDARSLSRALDLPVVEPSDARECRTHLAAALDLSERWGTPVVVRLTARLALEARPVELGERVAPAAAGLRRDRACRVLVPEHGPRLRGRLEERLAQLAAEGVESPLNSTELRGRGLGVVVGGAAYHLVREVLPDASVLKLGLSFPLPTELARAFAAAVKELVVVEEGEPVLESELRAAGIRCRGKDLLPGAGELLPAALARAVGGATRSWGAPPELPPRPVEACPGCPGRTLFAALKRLHVGVTADVECSALGVFAPQAVVDSALTAGSAPALLHGAEAVLGARMRGRLVAVVSERTFLHSGALALAQATGAGGRGTLVVLQDGESDGAVPGFDLAGLARALGAARVRTVDPADLAGCEAALREELAAQAPAVVLVRGRCPPPVRSGPPNAVAPGRCNRCGACLRLGCPAISDGLSAMVIDPDVCAGCGLCAQVCRAGAIATAEQAV